MVTALIFASLAIIICVVMGLIFTQLTRGRICVLKLKIGPERFRLVDLEIGQR